MSPDDYESELTASRAEIAAALTSVADGLRAGSIRLGDGEDGVVVEMPEELSLELELETEDDETSLELELEWPTLADTPTDSAADAPTDAATDTAADATVDTPTDSAAETPTDAPDEALSVRDEAASTLVTAPDATQSLARFELFRDRRDEWRWRLRHRNGNVIATSGEGYTRKHNATKGLRSVVENSPQADVVEEP